jgi:threonine dehydratase
VPSLDAMVLARARLGAAVLETPLVPLRQPGADTSAGIWLKVETHQVIGSFKIRGVFHACATMKSEERAAGLSTVSAGNTAQALAWCGRHFGVPAYCLMPESAPKSKIAAVERLGGIARLVERAEIFAFLKERRWEEEPYAFVHPWIDPRVIAGHASLGLELAEQHPELRAVYVPVGGGGLIAGVASALRARLPTARVVAVEPASCPALATAFERGAGVEVACSTICDGIAVPYITGEMLPLLRELVDEVVLVEDDAVRDVMRLLLVENKLLVEPAGAIAIAAALTRDDGGARACVVSGGSIDPAAVVAGSL